jgi:HK97 family phage major capsid protein
MSKKLEQILRDLASKPIERAISIDRAAVDEENRTVSLAFASDRSVEHWFGNLQLSMKPGAMRTVRLDSGAPLLMDHNSRDQVGVVEEYSIDQKAGMARAVVRFSDSTRGEEIFRDVKNGIRRNVSVGFMVNSLELIEENKGEMPTYRCDDWEPMEISIVSMPADTSVGVGRSLDFEGEVPAILSNDSPIERGNSTNTEKIMSDKNDNQPVTPVVEARSPEADLIKRTKELVEFAEIFGKGDLARSLVAANPAATIDDVRAAIKSSQPEATAVPPAPAVMAAERQGGVQLARTIPRYSTLRNFTGEHAAERAHRFGQWFMAARALGNGLSGEGAFARSIDFCRDNGIKVTRAMSEGVNESGGFLVPEEFGNDLIDLREMYGVFRRNAKNVPMSSDTRSDPRRTGGLTAYFANEADAITASDKAWDRVDLTAKKLTALSRYSNELNEDAVINMADDLAGEIAYAFALKEDQCGFIGDGTSTYGGMQGVTTKIKGLSGTIANIAGLVVATGTGYGTNYASTVLTDFEAVAAKLPVYADTPRAKWYCHKSFYWNVMVKLALAAGGATGSETTSGVAKRFLGYDVEFVQVLPASSAVSQVCALLGDLSLAASFGSRRDTTIAISEHSRFANDQLEIRGTERFDINVHDVGNASATAGSRVPGPIVGLITASS